MRPVTLITGASSGIGAALARIFAEHGHETVLVARREDRLTALAAEIEAKGHLRPIVLKADLERHDVADEIAERLSALGVEPEIVVNNAGFGLVGPADAVSRERQLAMVDVNVRALTDLSLAFVDSLSRHRGGILNVASIVSFMPGPRMAIYYASKAFVLSFGQALHQDLAHRGIRVTTLCPGPVPTEFHDHSGLVPGSLPKIMTLSAEQVARVGFHSLKRGKRVVIPGLYNWLGVRLSQLVPNALLLPLIDWGTMRRSLRP